ncbi:MULTISPECIES: hypothetical protein [unclassified Nonomuraea]|uniref:hypothetical protein n=1 Tax=unclassified Nonomuraea TaxID=2593643 RepID=UPI0033FB1D18
MNLVPENTGSVQDERSVVIEEVAAALAPADGTLPFGELLDLGLAAVTVVQIGIEWTELWREAATSSSRGRARDPGGPERDLRALCATLLNQQLWSLFWAAPADRYGKRRFGEKMAFTSGIDCSHDLVFTGVGDG